MSNYELTGLEKIALAAWAWREYDYPMSGLRFELLKAAIEAHFEKETSND